MNTKHAAAHPDSYQLSDYLDGDLTPLDRQEIEAHVSACEVCATLVSELRQVAEQARGLALPSEPETDLWPGIQRRLKPRATPTAADRWGWWRLRSGGRTLNVPALAIAATLVIACAASVAWLVSTPRHAITTGERAARPAGVITTGVSEPEYAEALATLRRAVHGSLTRDPRVLDVIEENLAVIDVAIAEYRDALAQAPGDGELRRRIEAARQRKLAVLRQAAALAPEGAN